MSMNGAQALIRTLADSGVEVCFSNPGTSEMHFVAALDSVPEMRAVLCLFEGSATAVRSVAERAAIPFGRILRGTGAPWSKERSSDDAAQARRRYS